MNLALERYKELVRPVDLADIDFADFADAPLDAEALRCIRYMHDIEFHTICYLRDLLVSPAHRDPEITGFLGFWVFEEYWHGEALAKVLACHGLPSGLERVRKLRRSLGLRDGVRPLLVNLVGALTGDDFIALHMAWGAVNEWTTQCGYARLADKADHPVLREILRRIMRQEGRHIDFYASQAEARLAESPRARRITRAALKFLWRPVGSGTLPREETAFLVDYLFGGDDGRSAIARVARNVDRLPGLAGLGLFERRLPSA